MEGGREGGREGRKEVGKDIYNRGLGCMEKEFFFLRISMEKGGC